MYVGRWSRLIADEFLAWLSLPPSLRWLDVGCGTGALTPSIAAMCRPARLIGVEPSEGSSQILAYKKRECIRERLPLQGDGSIPLVARAWAIESRIPA